MQDDLEVARKETFDLWSKLVECKSDLKRERHINNIAWTYIPEAQRDEYILDWPCGQMVWSGPSSPSPASSKFQSSAMNQTDKCADAHSRQFSEDVVKILEPEQTDRSARLCEAAEGHAEDGTIN